MSKKIPGLFIVGTDTNVGKTYVGAMIARALKDAGHRVGVYKPVASGCVKQGERMVSEDALTLWKAAGNPGDLEHVCPQCFAAPLAPHLAAKAEGKRIDQKLLRTGLNYWRSCSDVIVVEGVGGLLTPIDEDYVADLARDIGFPLVVVARNALGTINHTLMTVNTAQTLCENIKIAGIVLNQATPPGDDQSIQTNRPEITFRTSAPVLAEVGWKAEDFDKKLDWFKLAGRA